MASLDGQARSDPKKKTYSLEGENELRAFVTLARPEWSVPKRRGKSFRSGRANVGRVIDKLRDIGVYDCEMLAERIDRNIINDQLNATGHVRFSREAIEAIRKHTFFIRSLEFTDTPFIRQVGSFASVPQMLAKKRIVGVSQSRAAPQSPRTGERSGMTMSASSPAGFGHKTPEPVKGPEKELAFDCGGELRLRGSQAKATKNRRRRRPSVSHDILLPGVGLDFSDEDEEFGREYGNENELGSGMKPAWEPEGGFWSDEPDKLPQINFGAGSTGSTCVPSSTGMGLRSRSAAEIRKAKTISFSLANTMDAETFSDAADYAPFANGPSQGANRIATAKGTTSLPEMKDAQGDSNLEMTAATSTHSLSGFNATKSLSKESVLRLPTAQAPDALPTHREVRNILGMGKAMRTAPLEARWTSKHHKSLDQQGEEMLREQAVLDEKLRFVRGVSQDDMRPSIAANIRARLREEALRDNTQGLAIQQHAWNVRKHINNMMGSRRDLTATRMKMQMLMGDVTEEEAKIRDDLAELGSAFKVSSTKHKHTEAEDAAEEGVKGSKRATHVDDRSGGSSPDSKPRRKKASAARPSAV